MLAVRGASWGGHSNSIFWPKVVSSVINGIKKNEQKSLALERKGSAFSWSGTALARVPWVPQNPWILKIRYNGTHELEFLTQS